LPNMLVVSPCDYNQTRAATLAIAHHEGPVYLRFGRPAWPVFTDSDAPFEIGKAQLMSPGDSVSVFATGHMVWKALEAGMALAENGVQAEIINIHTIKPLDEAAVIQSAKKTGCVVTVEEHQVNGGLGDAICQVLSKHHPVPVEVVGVEDRFGQSGTPEQLLEAYGLGAGHIAEAVRRVLDRQKKGNGVGVHA